MFDPRTELANNHAHPFDPIGGIDDSYDSCGDMNFGAKAQKTAQNYENYRNRKGGGVQFRPDNTEEESGVCSPPLWRSTTASSPPRSPVHPRHPQNSYRNLSPKSRTQAIARGQWELMEMVKNMPESSYELSLRDLVEHPRILEAQERSRQIVEDRSFGNEIANRGVKVKRQESNNKVNEKKAKMMKSGSINDNSGLFLKMVFPVSFGSKKKMNSVTNTCAKVSPKPEVLEKSSKGVEKEWWKKRFSVSGESESGVSSSSGSGRTGSGGSSRSNSGRKKSACLPGFLSFFHSKKSISAK